ncbi:MAG: PIN domain-containing protein [Candidatus Pacearchaeota archaeon]|nr:PIN domain-containing protein [Candidatus Pacearchaeota archaeon]
MKQILLDTNFILSCIKQKIDFFEEIYLMGIQIIIPEEVIKELEKLKQEQALRLLENVKDKFKTIPLKGKNVDNAIIKYAKENPEVIIATLDREIKTKVKNRKMIIRNKKKLEII